VCFQPSEQDEKCRKLQYEKDSLQLQVQVLTDQIEAQTDKIAELEKTLMEKKQLLSDNEDKFQREVLSRSSLETQKLELMSIMSELKLQQAALERENMELRSQFNNNGDVKKPPLVPRMSQTSTPVHHAGNQALRMSPSPSPVTMTGSSPRREQEVQAPKVSGLEDEFVKIETRSVADSSGELQATDRSPLRKLAASAIHQQRRRHLHGRLERESVEEGCGVR
jgi:hypothetical protein